MNIELSNTEVAFVAAAVVVVVAYFALILVPAVSAYGRFWERVAAGFLTLYILGALLAVGADAISMDSS